MSKPDFSSGKSPIRVLVVIVNYKTATLTVACLRSLAAEVALHPWIKVTVVENDSGDGAVLAASIRANGWGDWVSLTLTERNGGFSYGNNRGIAPALRWSEPPDYFLILNPDTEVRTGAIRALADFLDEHPRVGIAGSSFEFEDGSAWPIAFRFHSALGQFEQGIRLGSVTRLLCKLTVARTMGAEPAEVDWVAGASMMIRRQVVRDIGLMDEGYFLYFEEADYCLQARRAGWPCWYVPQSRVMHMCGQSTGVSSRDNKLKRMPAYWFASRSRYFVKNHGLAYARIADVAFGVGLALWNLRRILTRHPQVDPPGMLADFWRSSVLFKSARDVRRLMGGPHIA
jgi:N-acetylglucosaminyl-diphospho-decaprenol L-rhamnosyltransferase